MKVYLITRATLGPEKDIMAVAETPKAARRWVDKQYECDSRKKWEKDSKGVRRFCPPRSIYFLYIEEHKVIKEKLNDA